MPPAPDTPTSKHRPRLLTLGAALIAFGAVCLGLKATVILVTGDQPPVLFEVAGLPLGLGLLLLIRWSIAAYGSARRLTAAAVLSVAAVLASTYWGAADMLGRTIPDWLESPLAIGGGFFPMIAALLIGLRLRALPDDASVIARRALLIAIMFVPLMLVGGIAADLAGERYLELGLLAFAALWLWLAHAMWTHKGPRAGRGERRRSRAEMS